ncbi:MAG TPA: hypothetical protein VGK24_01220 [Candidatus Angelobacter sp.]|jgi:hypothetical protein
MKRVLTFVFAFLMAASMSLMAQDTDKKTDKAEKKEAKAAAKDKSMTLTGWIKDQDGKTMFVNDKDKQAWNISNMDAVKGHEGHHVKIRAKLNESDHSVNVEKVTMLRKGKQTGEEQKAEEKK